MLQKLLVELIKMLQSIGYKVVLVNSDQSAVNRKCFKSLGITQENPYFDVNNQKIFGTFDVPHLFKSVSKEISFEIAENHELMVNKVYLPSLYLITILIKKKTTFVWERGKILKA